MAERIISEEDIEELENPELDSDTDIHLWLADLKKAIDFDSREEAEGARKLVEKAALLLGTHGAQVLKEEIDQ